MFLWQSKDKSQVWSFDSYGLGRDSVSKRLFLKASKRTNAGHGETKKILYLYLMGIEIFSTRIMILEFTIVCADILYMNNLQTGSILDYTLAYLGAVLARVSEKWDQPSKTGLIEITTSREYYRVYSGFQFVRHFVLYCDAQWLGLLLFCEQSVLQSLL